MTNLKQLATAIELEVGFVPYFWEMNAPGNGFPVDEDTARVLFGQKWANTERIIEEYPAYKIVEPTPRKVWKADETFALPIRTRNHGTLWHFYMLSSVVSYAMRYNNCPIEALDRARENKHQLHFAVTLPTVISAHPKPQQTVVGLSWGDLIKFEGRTFELKRSPNDNVSLVEVVS
jgi:hypothetical protein